METIIYEVDECVVSVEHWSDDYTVFWVAGPVGVMISVNIDENGKATIWGGEIGGIRSETARGFSAALVVAAEIAETGIDWKPSNE